MRSAALSPAAPLQVALNIDRDLQPLYDWIVGVPAGKRPRELLFLLRVSYCSPGLPRALAAIVPAAARGPDLVRVRVRVYPDMGEVYNHLAQIPVRARAREVTQRLREFMTGATTTSNGVAPPVASIAIAPAKNASDKREFSAQLQIGDFSGLDGMPGAETFGL